MLRVNEIFDSIQGEGFWTGLPVTFIRLQGCNLRCSWCDTPNALYKGGGTKMYITDIVKRCNRKVAVVTGGEPFLQKEVECLILSLQGKGKTVHIETNGTIDRSISLDCWLTVSPKPPKYFVTDDSLLRCNELKYIVDEEFVSGVVPKVVLTPVFLQPENNRPEMIKKTLDILNDNPQWRLSLQIHKMINVK